MLARISSNIKWIVGVVGGLFFFLLGRRMQANKKLRQDVKTLRNQATVNEKKFIDDQQVMQKLSEENADVRTENVAQKLNDHFNH